MKRRNFLGAIGALFCGAGAVKAAKPECEIPSKGSPFPMSDNDPMMAGFIARPGDVVMAEHINGEWIVVARSA